jgi:hypothetical protein
MRRLLWLALLSTALADQGAPVYQTTGTLPATLRACVGTRVEIEVLTGIAWACQSGVWVKIGDPTQRFVLQTPDTAYPYAFALSSASDGLLLNQTGIGIVGVKAANTCTAQFPRSDTASGVWTCASIATADLPTIVGTKGGTGLTSTTPGGVLVGAATNTTAFSAAGTNTLHVLHSGIAGVPTWSRISVNTINTTNAASAGNFLRGDGTWSAAGGSGAPGGTNTMVQYNDNGGFGGVAGFTFDAATNTLTAGTFVGKVTGNVTGSANTISPAGTTSQFWRGDNTWNTVSLAAHTPNQGTTTTVLHGNASGQPTYAAVNLIADTTADLLTQAKGGTGSGSLTCSAGQHLTSNGTTYSCTADSGGALSAATATVLGGIKGTGTAIVCSGTDKMVGWAADGTMSCSTDLGGGASPNYVEVDVDFGSPETDDLATTVVTGQAWVTATSKITCAPTMLATSSREEGMEDAVIEGLVVGVHTRVVGTGFTVTAASTAPLGTTGIYKIHCIGG